MYSNDTGVETLPYILSEVDQDESPVDTGDFVFGEDDLDPNESPVETLPNILYEDNPDEAQIIGSLPNGTELSEDEEENFLSLLDEISGANETDETDETDATDATDETDETDETYETDFGDIDLEALKEAAEKYEEEREEHKVEIGEEPYTGPCTITQKIFKDTDGKIYITVERVYVNSGAVAYEDPLTGGAYDDYHYVGGGVIPMN